MPFLSDWYIRREALEELRKRKFELVDNCIEFKQVVGHCLNDERATRERLNVITSYMKYTSGQMTAYEREATRQHVHFLLEKNRDLFSLDVVRELYTVYYITYNILAMFF